MKYSCLIFKRAFAPAWAIFSGVVAAATPLANAIAGENYSVQYVALGIFLVTFSIVFLRLVITPYLIWSDDQKVIASLKASSGDPHKDNKIRLFEAAGDLLSEAKTIYAEWAVSDERKRTYLLSGYTSERKRVDALAHKLIVQETIFRAAQDSMNAADVMYHHAINDEPDHGDLLTATAAFRELSKLLHPDQDA